MIPLLVAAVNLFLKCILFLKEIFMRYWLCILCFIPFSYSYASLNYQVLVNKNLKQLDVKICSDKSLPSQYALGRSSSSQNLKSFILHSHSKPTKNIKLYRGRLYLSDTSMGNCISYQIDLTKSLVDDNKTVLIDNRDWLLYPKTTQQVKVQFHFEDPEHKVSTPWPKSSSNGSNLVYILPRYPKNQSSKTVFGKVHLESINIKKAKLEIALIGTENKKRLNEYVKWIKDTADILDMHTGLFPQRPVQIILAAKGTQREAVPWAEVQRGGGASVHFYVDEFRDINDFYQDWTAVHELSHLYLPNLQTEDLWLSEGLATYYQVILRSKAKITTSSQGWQKLLSGFNRGKRADNGLNLRQTNATQHYYWGGTAYFLMADVALRTHTNKTLFSVMNQFVNCCVNEGGQWSAEKFTAKLDSLSQTTVFTDLLEKEALSRSFPNVDPVLAQLGVTQSFWGRIRINDDQGYEMRNKIMSSQ
jgi:predicted metalloprotease with PDZ domain